MTTPALDYRLITAAIQTGACDDALELIQQSIRARQQKIGWDRAMSLQPGDEFYLPATVTPKLLAGARVEFVKWSDAKRDKLEVRLRSYVGSSKWREGGIITLPVTLIGEMR